MEQHSNQTKHDTTQNKTLTTKSVAPLKESHLNVEMRPLTPRGSQKSIDRSPQKSATRTETKPTT